MRETPHLFFFLCIVFFFFQVDVDVQFPDRLFEDIESSSGAATSKSLGPVSDDDEDDDDDDDEAAQERGQKFLSLSLQEEMGVSENSRLNNCLVRVDSRRDGEDEFPKPRERREEAGGDESNFGVSHWCPDTDAYARICRERLQWEEKDIDAALFVFEQIRQRNWKGIDPSALSVSRTNRNLIRYASNLG